MCDLNYLMKNQLKF